MSIIDIIFIVIVGLGILFGLVGKAPRKVFRLILVLISLGLAFTASTIAIDKAKEFTLSELSITAETFEGDTYVKPIIYDLYDANPEHTEKISASGITEEVKASREQAAIEEFLGMKSMDAIKYLLAQENTDNIFAKLYESVPEYRNFVEGDVIGLVRIVLFFVLGLVFLIVIPFVFNFLFGIFFIGAKKHTAKKTLGLVSGVKKAIIAVFLAMPLVFLYPVLPVATDYFKDEINQYGAMVPTEAQKIADSVQVELPFEVETVTQEMVKEAVDKHITKSFVLTTLDKLFDSDANIPVITETVKDGDSEYKVNYYKTVKSIAELVPAIDTVINEASKAFSEESTQQTSELISIASKIRRMEDTQNTSSFNVNEYVALINKYVGILTKKEGQTNDFYDAIQALDTKLQGSDVKVVSLVKGLIGFVFQDTFEIAFSIDGEDYQAYLDTKAAEQALFEAQELAKKQEDPEYEVQEYKYQAFNFDFNKSGSIFANISNTVKESLASYVIKPVQLDATHYYYYNFLTTDFATDEALPAAAKEAIATGFYGTTDLTQIKSIKDKFSAFYTSIEFGTASLTNEIVPCILQEVFTVITDAPLLGGICQAIPQAKDYASFAPVLSELLGDVKFFEVEDEKVKWNDMSKTITTISEKVVGEEESILSKVSPFLSLLGGGDLDISSIISIVQNYDDPEFLREVIKAVGGSETLNSTIVNMLIGMLNYDGDIKTLTFEDGAGSGAYASSNWKQEEYGNNGWANVTGKMNSRNNPESSSKVVNFATGYKMTQRFTYAENNGTTSLGLADAISMDFGNYFQGASTIKAKVKVVYVEDGTQKEMFVLGTQNDFADIPVGTTLENTGKLKFGKEIDVRAIVVVTKGTLSSAQYLYCDNITLWDEANISLAEDKNINALFEILKLAPAINPPQGKTAVQVIGEIENIDQVFTAIGASDFNRPISSFLGSMISTMVSGSTVKLDLSVPANVTGLCSMLQLVPVISANDKIAALAQVSNLESIITNIGGSCFNSLISGVFEGVIKSALSYNSALNVDFSQSADVSGFMALTQLLPVASASDKTAALAQVQNLNTVLTTVGASHFNGAISAMFEGVIKSALSYSSALNVDFSQSADVSGFMALTQLLPVASASDKTAALAQVQNLSSVLTTVGASHFNGAVSAMFEGVIKSALSYSSAIGVDFSDSKDVTGFINVLALLGASSSTANLAGLSDETYAGIGASHFNNAISSYLLTTAKNAAIGSEAEFNQTISLAVPADVTALKAVLVFNSSTDLDDTETNLNTLFGKFGASTAFGKLMGIAISTGLESQIGGTFAFASPYDLTVESDRTSLASALGYIHDTSTSPFKTDAEFDALFTKWTANTNTTACMGAMMTSIVETAFKAVNSSFKMDGIFDLTVAADKTAIKSALGLIEYISDQDTTPTIDGMIAKFEGMIPSSVIKSTGDVSSNKGVLCSIIGIKPAEQSQLQIDGTIASIRVQLINDLGAGLTDNIDSFLKLFQATSTQPV